MFTIEELQSAKSSGHNLFSPERSRLAYEFSLMTGCERGVCAERMLYNRLANDGFDVTHIGGSNSYDILLSGDKDYRIEVKLATYGMLYQTPKKKYYGYSFRNIKPDLFDYLFLILVTPDGLLVKWTDVESVKYYTCDKRESVNGYTMTANEKRKIRDMNNKIYDFSEFSYDAIERIQSKSNKKTDWLSDILASAYAA